MVGSNKEINISSGICKNLPRGRPKRVLLNTQCRQGIRSACLVCTAYAFPKPIHCEYPAYALPTLPMLSINCICPVYNAHALPNPVHCLCPAYALLTLPMLSINCLCLVYTAQAVPV